MLRWSIILIDFVFLASLLLIIEVIKKTRLDDH